MIRRHLRNPVYIAIAQPETTLSAIDQVYYEVSERDKVDGLLELLNHTKNFSGYLEARESCKKALAKLPLMKQWRKVACLGPNTLEFDVEFFFADFMLVRRPAS